MAEPLALQPLKLARSRIHDRALTVVFPEGDDARIQEAADELTSAFPKLRVLLVCLQGGDNVGARSRVTRLLPENDKALEGLANLYVQNRPGTAIEVARRFARKPMYYAGLSLAGGRVDAMVAGVTCPTARVIEAAMLTVGLASGVASPSSCIVMCPPGSGDNLIFADCAVVTDPSAEELAAIAVASALTCRNLLQMEPRVAFLSFSTHGSAKHASAERVKQAMEIAKSNCAWAEFDGELQADAALSARVAGLKVKRPSRVAGQANVLVFPDLNSGNIAYKLVQQLADYTAIGPLLQGFAKPVADLSRNAGVRDIVDTTILTLARGVSA